MFVIRSFVTIPFGQKRISLPKIRLDSITITICQGIATVSENSLLAYRDVNLVSISLNFIHNLISLILFRMTFLFVHWVQDFLAGFYYKNSAHGYRGSTLLLTHLERREREREEVGWIWRTEDRPKMQVTLKLASYFHTNVRDLSQFVRFTTE